MTRMTTRFAQALALTALLSPSLAQAELADPIADPIADVETALIDLCGASRGLKRHVTARDVTGDGARDLLVRYAMRCGDHDRAFCDARGCPIEAYVRLPGGGYALAAIWRAERARPGSRRGRLVVRLSGGVQRCAPGAPSPCEPEFAWTGAAFARVDPGAPRGAPSDAALPRVGFFSTDRGVESDLAEGADGRATLFLDCAHGPVSVGLAAEVEDPQSAAALEDALAVLRRTEADLVDDREVAAALATANRALAQVGQGPVTLDRLDAAAYAPADVRAQLDALAARCRD